MGTVRSFFAALIMILALAMPARAEVEHLKRSVVRVVIIYEDEFGTQKLVSHGSGFAVTPTTIVTNEHVVRDYLKGKAAGQKMGVWVVPARGGNVIQGAVKVADASYDLAVVTLLDGTLPRATIYGADITGDTDAAVLGYPGNVDRALRRTADDYIVPSAPEARKAQITSANTSKAPWNSERGVFVHDLATAPGDSGGALADLCGRVLGVNESGTVNPLTPMNPEGTVVGTSGANFGFAITTADLRQFLKDNDVAFAATTQPCISEADYAQKKLEMQVADRDKAIATIEQKATSEAAAARRTDLWTIVLDLALLAAAAFAFVRYRAGDRTQAVILAGVAFAALIGIFLVQRPGTAKASERVLADDSTSRCTLDPVASRIIFDTDDNNVKTELKLAAGQCVGKTRSVYARYGNQLRHVSLAPETESLSVSAIDLESGRFDYRSYLLERDAYQKAVAGLANLPDPSCSAKGADKAGQDTAAARLAAIDPLLPATPTETIVWNCKPNAPDPAKKP